MSVHARGDKEKMKKKFSQTDEADELRRRAEKEVSLRDKNESSFAADADLQRLVHELQVHQIELEMQNEELRQSRAEVEAGLERYTELYDFAPVGYFSVRKDGTIRQVNLHGARLLGLERARLVGRRFGLFVERDRSPSFATFLEQAFTSQVRQTCEMILQKEDGEVFWGQIEAVVVKDCQECHMVVMDIHARKQAERKLQHLSMHDQLTELYNRSYFIETLERLERGRQFPVSILMADVDHLKMVNDSLGHAVGDAMLKRVAQVLTLTFRSEDVIARIGGDEFAVLLPNTDGKAADAVVRRFHEILKEHNSNCFTEKPLSISIGIATAGEYGISLNETMKRADAKMYLQKRG